MPARRVATFVAGDYLGPNSGFGLAPQFVLFVAGSQPRVARPYWKPPLRVGAAWLQLDQQRLLKALLFSLLVHACLLAIRFALPDQAPSDTNSASTEQNPNASLNIVLAAPGNHAAAAAAAAAGAAGNAAAPAQTMAANTIAAPPPPPLPPHSFAGSLPAATKSSPAAEPVQTRPGAKHAPPPPVVHRLRRPKVIAQRTPELTTFSVPMANNDAATEGKDSERDTPTPELAVTPRIPEEKTDPNADVENEKRLAAERLIQEQQAQAEKLARETAAQAKLAAQQAAREAAARAARQLEMQRQEADRQAAAEAELARKQEQEAVAQRQAEAAQRREQELAAQRQAETARQKLAEEQRRADQAARLAAAEAARKQAELQAKEQAEKAAAALALAAAQATGSAAGAGSGGGDANNASAADAGKQPTSGRGRAEAGDDGASKGQAALLASPGDQTGKGSTKGKDTEQSGGGRLEQGRGAAGSGQGQPGGTSGDQRPAAGKGEGNGPGVAAGGGGEGSAPGKAGGDPAPVRVAQPTVKKEAPAAIPTRAPLPDDPCRQKTDGWYKPDTQVELYAAVWRHGVSWNGDFELLQDAKEGAYQNPLVSVAIRSDGYVDKVTFIKSSGQAGLDGAIRRVIQVLSPFTPFSRELASQCDVIEFPSLWTFNQALRVTWRGQ